MPKDAVRPQKEYDGTKSKTSPAVSRVTTFQYSHVSNSCYRCNVCAPIHSFEGGVRIDCGWMYQCATQPANTASASLKLWRIHKKEQDCDSQLLRDFVAMDLYLVGALSTFSNGAI